MASNSFVTLLKVIISVYYSGNLVGTLIVGTVNV